MLNVKALVFEKAEVFVRPDSEPSQRAHNSCALNPKRAKNIMNICRVSYVRFRQPRGAGHRRCRREDKRNRNGQRREIRTLTSSISEGDTGGLSVKEPQL